MAELSSRRVGLDMGGPWSQDKNSGRGKFLVVPSIGGQCPCWERPGSLWSLRVHRRPGPSKILLDERFSHFIFLLPCWLYFDPCFKMRELRITEE